VCSLREKVKAAANNDKGRLISITDFYRNNAMFDDSPSGPTWQRPSSNILQVNVMIN
jgi:hypothetical protein